jgi:hypothetical protein
MYMVAHKRLLTLDIIKDYHFLFVAPTGLYLDTRPWQDAKTRRI